MEKIRTFFLAKTLHNASKTIKQTFVNICVDLNSFGDELRSYDPEMILDGGFMVTANLPHGGDWLDCLALSAVFFSPYRRWLGFMLAGMAFWGLLEVVRLACKHFLRCQSPIVI
jgi:hypothetical protein